MRITDIYIKNYRAFYGEYHICLDKAGKNLMIYGENGSGKSSIFSALHDFLESSVNQVDVKENIFIPKSSKNTASIKIDIKESPTSNKTTTYELSILDKEIKCEDKSLIINANKIKGFLDYRSLLKTHIGFNEKVNLFDILIKDILYNSVNRISTTEIGKEWLTIYDDTYNKRQIPRHKEAIKNYLSERFNPGLKQLLEDIEQDTNTFMCFFGSNVRIKLEFDKVEYHGRRNLSGNNINLIIDFFREPIPKHQFFLNEARLSALAISLYLAAIRINPLSSALKVLVLDDLLIGLDMSNRLPLLGILKKYFIEVEKENQFQIIMTTYDKAWYELVRNYFGSENWKYIEIYNKSLKDDDFEIPIIFSETGYLDKAKTYLSNKDYKASAVYIRTEFERICKTICDKHRIPVAFKKNQKEVTTDDFWAAIESHTNLDPVIIKDIKVHKSLVMNPFSHYDLEKPEFERELIDTITSIEKLKAEMDKLVKNRSIEKLEKEIAELNSKLGKKEKLIEELGTKLKEK